MAERPYKPVAIPDWRVLRDDRSEEAKRLDKDVMGYPLSQFLAHFTPAEIRAAKAMAAMKGYEWDCVGTDPRVTGRPFLDYARVALAVANDDT